MTDKTVAGIFLINQAIAAGLVQTGISMPSEFLSEIVRRCYCEGHCPNGQANGTCETRSGGACFTDVEAYVEDGIEYPIRRYGCFPPDEGTLMQCKGHLVPHSQGKSIKCCDDRDFCNKNLQPMYTPRPTLDVPNFNVQDNLPTLIILSMAILFFVILLVIVSILYFRNRKKDLHSKCHLYSETCSDKCGKMEIHGPLVNLIEQSSGSGSGLPILVQRTISKQLQMVKSIGKGRYGEVWLANWRGEDVAVKVFLTTEEQSWFREKEIYQTVVMRHDNILGFIAADIRGSGNWTQMLLITEYHERGSLYDYLQERCIDTTTLLMMASSIASGLAYLHTEIYSTRGKPAVAHRDIKSKNILVKENGECCIADFGLAVKYLHETKSINVPPSVRSGTRRYMAPEILDKTIDVHNFEAHKKADMYAFSLVLWEMCRRCMTGDKIKFADEYAVPYYDCVPKDPSFDDMLHAVCTKNIRPQIQPRWEHDDILQAMIKIMKECWHTVPEVRLTSLRVNKTLSKLNPDYSCIKIV